MNDLTLNILGFPAVNRDLTVELRDPLTQRVVREVKPFLDGTVRISKLDPGAYEMTLKHPNLTLPVLRRPIRVLPTGDTKVSVLIDPSQFRNTPIEDIPEANLQPIADAAKSIAETVTPLVAKHPGEAIRSDDWNRLAGSIIDLANAVAELTRVVSPVGHNHVEYERKFDEITGNFPTLLETLSSSLAELQRQVQTRQLREQVQGVLDRAAIDPASARGKELLELVDGLDDKVNETPTAFGRAYRNVGTRLSTQIEALLDERQNDPALAASEEVRKLSAAAELATQQRTTTYDAELLFQRKSQRILGPGRTRLGGGL